MARMSDLDRWGYAKYLGLNKRETARLSDSQLRNQAARKLPHEEKELDRVVHKEYILPGNLPITTEEVIKLYQIISEKETTYQAGYISDYYYETEEQMKNRPSEQAFWRRTHMENRTESEIVEEDLSRMESGEYQSLAFLGGRTFTFMKSKGD